MFVSDKIIPYRGPGSASDNTTTEYGFKNFTSIFTKKFTLKWMKPYNNLSHTLHGLMATVIGKSIFLLPGSASTYGSFWIFV
jgi:hypothetical protein